MPELPLLERAHALVIFRSRRYRAIIGTGATIHRIANEIALAAPEEKVFFHELAHAAHEKVKGSLTTGQDPLQEIVAELSAQALCRLVGKRIVDTTGNSYQYIERYAEKIKMSPYTACLKVLADTEKVMGLILTGTQPS